MAQKDRSVPADSTGASGSGPDAIAFVYNADRGLFNTLTDVAHKLLSPSTYACNLCSITHSPVGMRKQWRSFLEELGLPLEFFHRDERNALGLDPQIQLPVILTRRGDHYDVLVGAARINAASSMQELGGVIESALRPTRGE